NTVSGSIRSETGAALTASATNGAANLQSPHPDRTRPESEALSRADSALRAWHPHFHSPQGVAPSDLHSKSEDLEFHALPPCLAWEPSEQPVSRPCRAQQPHTSNLRPQHRAARRALRPIGASALSPYQAAGRAMLRVPDSYDSLLPTHWEFSMTCIHSSHRPVLVVICNR